MARAQVAIPENPRIPNDWVPRADQRALWHYLESGGKRAVEIAHRRWGKDDVALHFTATAMMDRVGNYWHMLPEYAQARKSIWDAVNVRTGRKRIDDAFPEWLRANTRETDMFIRLKNGSTWQLVGSDNYDALVGSPPIGVVFSEWALANPMCWPFLMPILAENGGWALWITTPRGNNHAKQTLDFARVTDGWFAQVLTAHETPVFTETELTEIRTELMSVYGPEQGEALFNQEYLCSFTGAVLGSYFGKQMELAREEGRITEVPYQVGQEVFTAWDLGIDDSMTIWFIQAIGKSYHCIDYYEASGYGLEHYAKLLREKPYLYSGHYMPHDAEQRELTNSEIALSRREVAENLGIKPIHTVNRVRNMDTKINVHIPAARNMIGQCWFDAKKCQQGISALEAYRTEYDDVKKKLGNRPVHDWSSHGSDAFLTFSVGYQPPIVIKPTTRLTGVNIGPQSWMM